MKQSKRNQDSPVNDEEYDPTYMHKKKDPIIFARAETTHLPVNLQHNSIVRDVNHTIYSTNEDGSLRRTSLSSIEDNELSTTVDNQQPSIWKRLFSCFKCCKRGSSEDTKEDPPPENTDTIVTNGPLLGEQRPCDVGKKTLVLDLDETLVHSSFQPSQSCQYTIPVEIEGNIYNVYVYRRPGAIEFIRRMSAIYEVVIYTASLKKYADPLLNQMDPDNLIAYRLFRDQCTFCDKVYIKDLGLLGRDLKSVIMVDNAADSYKFQPKNGIECTPFFNDFSDQELSLLTPFLEYLSKKSDVRLYAKLWNETRESQSQVVPYKK